ncbi:sugar ABC transporter substrate-binding protein [Paenibacillus terrae]|uniref:Sugar ABC transporter substrate-binding protein n=1 Tax=Paenibacillus terrae TaxID=159743 RepID=A0A4U2PW38_9BACL|nr:sugar ABC transporter substrate-binding protein [Paenibacillus terrae]TKH42899.1 sugar ABC transporter substrate-binding protein [Paenibacillus terrae]
MGDRKKSLLRIGAVALLSLSVVLSGCSISGSSKGGNSNADNVNSGEVGAASPIEISVFLNEAGQQPTADNKLYKMMKDELGVTFKFEFLAGDKNQKLGVMIAGGDYPDLISADTKLTAAGGVIPLEDLIEKHAPNLKKHYAKYWNQMKDPNDGHIYYLPNYGVYNGEVADTYYGGPAFWIQKAVLKEFNYPTPKTLDEYFDLIKKYKDKYPTIDGSPTLGFEVLNYDWKTWGLLNPPQHLIGHPNDGGVVVNKGVAEIFADKDYAKKYYQKLNEINAQDLLDKETFTQNYDQYLAKLSNGNVLGMFDQHWNFLKAEDSLKTQKKLERTYVGFPLVYDSSIKDYYRDRPALNLNNGFGITVNAKDPVKILKVLDKLMDEKWQKLFTWGVEGEDYYVNKQGRFMKTPEQRTNTDDAAWKLANKAEALYNTAPKLEGYFSDGNATTATNQPEEYQASLKPYDKEVLKAYGFNSYVDFFSAPPENPVYYPAWSADIVDGSPAKIASTKLNELSTKYLPKAILSSPSSFDSVWNEYTSEIHKLDIKAYEDKINEVLKWRIENWTAK